MVQFILKPEFRGKDEKGTVAPVMADTAVIRLGIVCVFFFIGVFLIPYVQGFLNGKLGFASMTNGKKLFTISQMIEVSNRILQVGIVFIFIALGNVYLAYQNFFDQIHDYRILVPVCSYIFGLAMIFLLWVPGKNYPIIHTALAMGVFFAGTLFNYIIWKLYDNYFEDNISIQVLKISSYATISIAVVVVLIAIINGLRKNQIQFGRVWLIDIFAALELLHVLFLTVTIYFVSTLPHLPSDCT